MNDDNHDAQKKRVQSLDDVAINMAAAYRLVDGAMAESRPDWIPCTAGCSWCCWSLNVLITWVEAYYVLREVSLWEPERQQALADRAAREVVMLLNDPAVAKVAEGGAIGKEDLDNLNQALRGKLRPCPLLDREKGQCSVYESRFIACRVFGHTAAGEDTGFYCGVVEEDVAKHEDVTLLDARPFYTPFYRMAGMPNVIALPISFWIDAVAKGPASGESYSLSNPDPLFERMLVLFQPLEVELKKKETP